MKGTDVKTLNNRNSEQYLNQVLDRELARIAKETHVPANKLAEEVYLALSNDSSLKKLVYSELEPLLGGSEL